MIYSEVNARNQVEFITGGYRDFTHPEPGVIRFVVAVLGYGMLVALSKAFDTQDVSIGASAEHCLTVEIRFAESGEVGG